MTKRTDPHRPGAIIPAEYEFVLAYGLPTTQDNWPIPSQGVNCELDRRHDIEDPNNPGKKISVNGEHRSDGHCCVIGLLHIAKVKFVAPPSSRARSGVTNRRRNTSTSATRALKSMSYSPTFLHTNSIEIDRK